MPLPQNRIDTLARDALFTVRLTVSADITASSESDNFLYWLRGRLASYNLVGPSLETQAACNEANFLHYDYLHRHIKAH